GVMVQPAGSGGGRPARAPVPPVHGRGWPPARTGGVRRSGGTATGPPPPSGRPRSGSPGGTGARRRRPPHPPRVGWWCSDCSWCGVLQVRWNVLHEVALAALFERALGGQPVDLGENASLPPADRPGECVSAQVRLVGRDFENALGVV